jgi:hypothetical protein
MIVKKMAYDEEVDDWQDIVSFAIGCDEYIVEALREDYEDFYDYRYQHIRKQSTKNSNDIQADRDAIRRVEGKL